MMHLDRYPAVAAAAIRQFAPAVSRWAAAAGVGIDDVQQEIVVAVLCGQEPAAAVPAALGLRRLTTGWCSKDLGVAAGLEPDYEPDATRQKFVRENLFYINMRPADYAGLGDHVEIAQINDQPLNYFPAAGVYAWSFPDQASTIMIWLSWPAQPPGW